MASHTYVLACLVIAILAGTSAAPAGNNEDDMFLQEKIVYQKQPFLAGPVEKSDITLRCFTPLGEIIEKCETIIVNVPFYLEQGCIISKSGCHVQQVQD